MTLTYDICRYIFYGGLVMAGLMFAVTVLLFFLLKIPEVIGDLSGRTARKAIENIRSQNEDSGEKLHKTSHINKERGKITDKISPSGNLIRQHTHRLGAMPTEKIAPNAPVVPAAEETTVLNNVDETTLLSNGNETTVLNGVGETVVLDTVMSVVTSSTVTSECFSVEYDITYIHTDEVIV